MKENKYDDAGFFTQYSRMERSTGGLAAAGEWPALQRMLPDMRGKRVLDLGCGFGWHCRYAAAQGAKSVVGIDLSERMLARARAETHAPNITYCRQAIEDIDGPPGAYDLVISSLALHYIESFADVCAAVYRLLDTPGNFVFSVEHPIFTAQGPQAWVDDADGNHLCWPVDRYFEEGRRTAVFLGEAVTKYHRTMTTYVQTLQRAGFALEAFEEPQPDPALLYSHPEYREEVRRPMMALFAAAKRA